MDLRGFREGTPFSGRGIWCTGRFGKFPKYWITTQSQGAAWFAENARKGKASRIWIEWKFDLEKTTNSGANLWQRKALHSNLPVPYWATTDSQSHLQLDVFFKLHLMEHPSHCTVTLPTRLLEKSQLPHSQEFSINRRHLLKEEPCLKVCGNFPSLLILPARIPTSRFTATSDDKVAVHRVWRDWIS